MITTVSETVEPVGGPPTETTSYQQEQQADTRGTHRVQPAVTTDTKHWQCRNLYISLHQAGEDRILFLNIFIVSRTYLYGV